MSPARPLSELFQVKARFYRSVSLVADYDDPAALSDYIFSPLGQTVLRRITEGLRPDARVRAWSIVGPYGAGKSAFALFLARVLGYPKNTEARERLRADDAGLYGELENHVPGWSEERLCHHTDRRQPRTVGSGCVTRTEGIAPLRGASAGLVPG